MDTTTPPADTTTADLHAEYARLRRRQAFHGDLSAGMLARRDALHNEIIRRNATPPDGYTLPKAAADLLAAARAAEWKTLVHWQADSGGAPFVTVQVGRRLTPDERDVFEARGANGPVWEYTATWHTRQARYRGPGPLRSWGVTGVSPERPYTHDLTVKGLREVIAANPAPEADR